MKRTPIKGRLDNFFSSLGKQLKAGQKDRGIFSEKGKAEKADRKPGESKFKADVRRRKATSKTKRNMVDKNKDNISDFIQPRSITTPSPKGQEKVSSKPESKGHYGTFSGKKGDKFKYRYRSQGPSGNPYDFQRPGSDVWEVPKTEAGTRVIQDLWSEDYEGKNYEVTPIQKKSPTKKSGFKMKRKK